MAYPSDNKPRRRLQAVPTTSQMVRRRAASPNGVVKNGVGLMGPPVQAGGIPTRRLPGQGGYAPPLPGSQTGPRPVPPVDPFHPQPPGGTPGPIIGPPTQEPPRPGYSGLDPNALVNPPGPDVQGQRNPLEHLDWWASKGWVYNPQTGRFRFTGGAGTPVPPAPIPAPDPTPVAAVEAVAQVVEALVAAEAQRPPAPRPTRPPDSPWTPTSRPSGGC